jgi:hypothetical protein
MVAGGAACLVAGAGLVRGGNSQYASYEGLGSAAYGLWRGNGCCSGGGWAVEDVSSATAGVVNGGRGSA